MMHERAKHRDELDAVMIVVVDDVTQRLNVGEDVDADEYVERFPKHE